MSDTDDLKGRLSAVLMEISDIMKARKDEVERLRDQITVMENENEDLERKVHELMNDF
mgnify:CR=1 FL=1